jgi:Flp pilus assembly protein TadG
MALRRCLAVRRPLAERGAILVESAIVLAAILVFVLGMLEFGLLGFMQITVDAGAFLNAHQTAIGVNDALGPADATHLVFPQIQAASIANAVQTAPSPNVPVDYGYNGTTSEQAAAGTNRHGGASMLQPYLSQTTISQSVFSLLNQNFSVHSQASEPNWLESAPLWDAADVNYGTAYSASNSEIDSSIFANGENSPLYYMGLDKINHCPTPGSWGNPSGSRGICPNTDILTLSSGEYLDYYNWSNGTAGIGGYANSTGPGGTTGTFEAAACHQRMLSTLVYWFQYLNANVYGNSAGFATDPFNWIETTYNPYYYNRSGYTNFSTVSFFANRPNGAASDGIDTLATNAIKEIYGWDVETYLGYGLGVNPLYPTRGCT